MKPEALYNESAKAWLCSACGEAIQTGSVHECVYAKATLDLRTEVMQASAVDEVAEPSNGDGAGSQADPMGEWLGGLVNDADSGPPAETTKGCFPAAQPPHDAMDHRERTLGELFSLAHRFIDARQVGDIALAAEEYRVSVTIRTRSHDGKPGKAGGRAS